MRIRLGFLNENQASAIWFYAMNLMWAGSSLASVLQ